MLFDQRKVILFAVLYGYPTTDPLKKKLNNSHAVNLVHLSLLFDGCNCFVCLCLHTCIGGEGGAVSVLIWGSIITVFISNPSFQLNAVILKANIQKKNIGETGRKHKWMREEWRDRQRGDSDRT